jgi:hypothetical protein
MAGAAFAGVIPAFMLMGDVGEAAAGRFSPT